VSIVHQCRLDIGKTERNFMTTRKARLRHIAISVADVAAA